MHLLIGFTILLASPFEIGANTSIEKHLDATAGMRFSSTFTRKKQHGVLQFSQVVQTELR